MNTNHLYVLKPKAGLAGMFVCVGNGAQLRTEIHHHDEHGNIFIHLPDLSAERRILLEYILVIPPTHTLHNWPDSYQGFYLMSGKHGESLRAWFVARGFPIPAEHQYFVRQVAVVPVLSTSNVLHEIYDLVFTSTGVVLKLAEIESQVKTQLGIQ